MCQATHLMPPLTVLLNIQTLNTAKRKLLIFPMQVNPTTDHPISTAGASILLTVKTKNLGIIPDPYLSFCCTKNQKVQTALLKKQIQNPIISPISTLIHQHSTTGVTFSLVFLPASSPSLFPTLQSEGGCYDLGQITPYSDPNHTLLPLAPE